MALDMDKLNTFVGQFVGDLGATVHTGMVVIGEKLGLYRALAQGPLSVAELAAKTQTDERYLREWLASQAAGGYVTYHDETDKFGLSEEQAFTLAMEDSPAYLPGAFQLALGALAAVPRITDSFRTGAGMGWHEHDESVFHGCEKFFRPGYAANLVTSWKPGPFAISASSVRTNKAAPMTSVKVKAICAVTMVFRSRTPPNAVPPRSRSDDTSDRRPECHAGARPLKTPAATVARNANSKRRESMAACKAVAALSFGRDAIRACTAIGEAAIPSTPPASAISRLSQGVDGPAARAKRRVPAWCLFRGRGPSRAPGTDRTRSSRPVLTIRPLRQIAPRVVLIIAAAAWSGLAAPR